MAAGTAWLDLSRPSDAAASATWGQRMDRAATTAPTRPDWAPRSPMRISGGSGHRSAARRRRGSMKAGASSAKPPEMMKTWGSRRAVRLAINIAQPSMAWRTADRARRSPAAARGRCRPTRSPDGADWPRAQTDPEIRSIAEARRRRRALRGMRSRPVPSSSRAPAGQRGRRDRGRLARGAGSSIVPASPAAP